MPDRLILLSGKYAIEYARRMERSLTHGERKTRLSPDQAEEALARNEAVNIEVTSGEVLGMLALQYLTEVTYIRDKRTGRVLATPSERLRALVEIAAYPYGNDAFECPSGPDFLVLRDRMNAIPDAVMAWALRQAQSDALCFP